VLFGRVNRRFYVFQLFQMPRNEGRSLVVGVTVTAVCPELASESSTRLSLPSASARRCSGCDGVVKGRHGHAGMQGLSKTTCQ